MDTLIKPILIRNLPLDVESLETVAKFLAPLYSMTPEEKMADIKRMLSTSDSEFSIETAGFLAFKSFGKVKFCLGNHLIGTQSIKIVKSKRMKKYKIKGNFYHA